MATVNVEKSEPCPQKDSICWQNTTQQLKTVDWSALLIFSSSFHFAHNGKSNSRQVSEAPVVVVGRKNCLLLLLMVFFMSY